MTVTATAAPQRRRRAWRSLLAGAALFVVGQLTLGQVAEHYVRLRDPLFGDKFARLERLVHPKSGGEREVVVMLGSSRTGLGFHGRVLTEEFADTSRPVVGFNFGTPAAGPVTAKVYFERLIDRGIRPALLLVEVLPANLADGHGGPVERHWFHSDRLVSAERGVVLGYGFEAAKVQPRWWKTVLVPSYALRFEMVSRIAASWLPWQVRFDWSRGSDEYGWGTSQKQQADAGRLARGTAQARAEYGPTLATLTPGGGAARALEDLLGRAKELGIPAALVLMPEGDAFRDMMPPDREAALTDYLQGLSARTGVKLVDARQWLPDENFSDGHHMFARGAEAFTRRLGREVVAPELGIDIGGGK